MKFSDSVKKLINWVEETNAIPIYNEIMVIESKSMKNNYSEILFEDLVSEKEYESRFQELLGIGFSWINVSLYGIWEGYLIIGIEYPYKGSNVPKEFVSINLSGPKLDMKHKPIWKIKVLK